MAQQKGQLAGFERRAFVLVLDPQGLDTDRVLLAGGVQCVLHRALEDQDGRVRLGVSVDFSVDLVILE